MAALASNPYLIPAMKAPPGLHSNLIDPPSTSHPIIVICVLVIVLPTPFVILRLYTRKFINHQVWWDDCSYSYHVNSYRLTSMLMNYDRVLRFRLDL